MDQSKLELKHYKGYKNIATTLEDSIKAGKSKVYQMKEWKRHFDWLEHGRYDWQVTIIHSEIKEKIDERKNNGSESKYGEIVDDLILMLLNRGYVNENKNFFYDEFNMFLVDDYFENQNRVTEIAEEMKIPLWIIDDYFQRVGAFMNNVFKASIDRLNKNESIEAMKIMMCKDIDGETREMIVFEIEQYTKIKEEVANKLGIYNANSIPPSLSLNYRRIVKEEVLKFMDIKSIWTVYDIVQGENYFEHTPILYALDPERWINKYIYLKNELNSILCESIIKNAKNRINKAIELKHYYEIDEEFFMDKKKEKYQKNKEKYKLLIEYQKEYIRVYEEFTDDFIKFVLVDTDG